MDPSKKRAKRNPAKPSKASKGKASKGKASKGKTKRNPGRAPGVYPPMNPRVGDVVGLVGGAYTADHGHTFKARKPGVVRDVVNGRYLVQFGKQVFSVPRSALVYPVKPAAKRNPAKVGPALTGHVARGSHPALDALKGSAQLLGFSCWALRVWPIFCPAENADRTFGYVPWLSRYYRISGAPLRSMLAEWEAAGLVELLVDDDRARVMAPADRKLCPKTVEGGMVVWFRMLSPKGR